MAGSWMSTLNKKLFWGAIQNVEEATRIISSAAYVFYFLAALLGLIGYSLVGPAVLIDVAILVGLAFLLHKRRKRVFAYLLLVYNLFVFRITLSNLLGITDEGGQNLALSLIAIWASVRAIQATSFLAKKKVSLTF